MDESLDVNAPVVADTTPTESSPVETTSSEVVADEFDGLGDIDLTNTEAVKVETESKPAPKEDAEPAVETDTDTQPQDVEKLSPKSENRFQTLANRNRELEAQLAQLTQRESQVATEQDLINQINPETGEYYTALDAERIARYQANESQQQTIAQQRQELQVQQSVNNLTSEATKIVTDFPMFDETSKEYNPDVAAQAEALLGENLIRSTTIPEIDPKTGQPTGLGQIIGSNISPYKLYKTIADSARAYGVKAQVSAQRATEKMLANADVTGGAPQKSSGDPLEDMFDKIKDYKFSG